MCLLIFAANISITQRLSASYWAIRNWRSLLPKGKYVNLGVLHALDAIADLALENYFFNFRHDLNERGGYDPEFTDRYPMRDLYPVILYWLFEEVCATKFE